MRTTARLVDGVDLDVLHDVKNAVGIVHAAAVDLARAHANGEELGELVSELVSLTSLVSESLRGLTQDGRRVRPFDLRCAAFCARFSQRNLALGALTRQQRVDAEAGPLTDFVIALAVALGANEGPVAIQEDERPGLRFEPSALLGSVAREAIEALSARAATLAICLEREGGCVRVRSKVF